MFLVLNQRDRRARHGPQADELPGHYPALLDARSAATRELPLRFHEQTCCTATKRPARSAGLTRVRQFSQDDGHVYLMEDRRSPSEVEALMRLDPRASTRPSASSTRRSSRRVPRSSSATIAMWDRAEAALKERARATGQAYDDQRRRRRVLRPEDRLRRHRRARPQVAAAARSSSTTSRRSAST